MHSELLLEFSSGWSCDNGMMAMSIRAGDPVDPGELIELCSGAKTVFSLVTLVCRGHDRILDCQQLWKNALDSFQKALIAWSDVPADHNPMVRFYLLQLHRLCELAEARVDLYSITFPERLAHASRRADTSETSYGSRYEHDAPQADKESYKSGPVYLYSMGRL